LSRREGSRNISFRRSLRKRESQTGSGGVKISNSTNSSTDNSQSGCIIAVGGGEDKFKKKLILRRFFDEAGGLGSTIAVVPTASRSPGEIGAMYREIFGDFGASRVDVLNIDSRHDADSDEFVDAIRRSSGVFLTGGNQLRLTSILGGSRIADALRDRLNEGAPLAGTSAGASAMSTHMIVTGKTGLRVNRSMVEIAPGLGVITKLIIDQHFSQRERLGRLLTAVAYNPHLLGVGIDEDTAILYRHEGLLEVLGSGQVIVVDASHLTYSNIDRAGKTRPLTMAGVRLHVLTDGDKFSVEMRELTAHLAERVPKPD